jgi:hypothetical protein
VDTCSYLRVSRERLGKDIECGNCSYLFSPDPPVGLPSGYKCEVRGPVFPLQAICVSVPFLLVHPSAALHRRRHFFLRHRMLFPMTMVGKS